uniref:Glycine N-methyltransferase n=1 Tax=Anas platyrhynchos platyrhynchos TaxID=8840 RepID=A0A493TJN8_ANAPP
MAVLLLPYSSLTPPLLLPYSSLTPPFSRAPPASSHSFQPLRSPRFPPPHSAAPRLAAPQAPAPTPATRGPWRAAGGAGGADWPRGPAGGRGAGKGAAGDWLAAGGSAGGVAREWRAGRSGAPGTGGSGAQRAGPRPERGRDRDRDRSRGRSRSRSGRRDGGQRVPDAVAGGGGGGAAGPVRGRAGGPRVAAVHRGHAEPHGRVPQLAPGAAPPAPLPLRARRGLRHRVRQPPFPPQSPPSPPGRPPDSRVPRVDSIMLLEEGFQVTSVDASDKMLKYALKERWERRKEEPFDRWVIEEANWLTLEKDLEKPGDGFDAVICLGNSFAHLPDFKGDQSDHKLALRNIASMVRPGGRPGHRPPQLRPHPGHGLCAARQEHLLQERLDQGHHHLGAAGEQQGPHGDPGLHRAGPPRRRRGPPRS